MTRQTPTPRDLDPNFVDATAPVDSPVDTESTETREETVVSEDEPMTVYRMPVVENGVQTFKEYGPMPTKVFDQWLRDFEAGKVTE